MWFKARWVSLSVFMLCSLVMEGQQSLTEVKRIAYGNPFNMANENFINVTNALDDNKMVSLLLFDDWKQLEVTGVEDELIIIDSANYHLEADKMLFVENGALFELFPEKVREAMIADHHFVSLLYEVDKKQLRRGYFEIIVSGDFSLLKKYDLERRITNSSALGLPASREENLMRTQELYYQTAPDRKPIVLPKKKTDFINIFRRDRREMVDFAKTNKLSPKVEDDAVMLFEHYNSLVN